MTIREFADDDYPGYAAVCNAVYPDYPQTVEEMRFHDSSREPKILHGRLLAEIDGSVAGCASWFNDSWSYHPRKFVLEVSVAPEHLGKGIGKALYAAALQALAPHAPTLLRGQAKETDARALRFLGERGFAEKMREWESRLIPEKFEPEDFSDVLEKAASENIELKSLAELSEDPNWEQKLHALDCAVCADIPSTDVYTPPDFTSWRRKTLENPNFWPEGYLIALDGERYVGESTLWKSQSDGSLYVGATGVLREYRRRGIAHALKVRAIEAAKARGVPVLKTWNATTNAGMLAINDKLGFVRQPAWLVLEKTL